MMNLIVDSKLTRDTKEILKQYEDDLLREHNELIMRKRVVDKEAADALEDCSGVDELIREGQPVLDPSTVWCVSDAVREIASLLAGWRRQCTDRLARLQTQQSAIADRRDEVERMLARIARTRDSLNACACDTAGCAP